jgi:peptidoglycan/xylan/chitin deacetylase (PgdA/CDA1 family)
MSNLFSMKLHMILVLAILMCFTCLFIDAQTNYYQCWTNGSGTVNCQNLSGGHYTVSWSNVGDFVAGKGWNPCNSANIQWSGSASGAQYFGVYGWLSSPITEYYIGRGGGTSAGTYSTSKGSYTLNSYSCNGANITGNGAFTQFNCSGSGSSPINMAEHFQGWKNLGKQVNTQNYCIVATEGWNSSGSADVTVSAASGSTTTSTGSTTTSSGGSTTTSSGGGGTVTLNSWQCNNHSSGLNIWTGGVGNWTVGAWIGFYNVNITGATSLTMSLGSTQSGSFTIYLDTSSGPLIGTLNYSSTGSWSTYQNFSCSLNLQGNSGTHNLVIMDAIGAANTGTITISTSSANPTNPPTSTTTSSGGGTTTTSSSTGSCNGSSGNVYLTFDDGPTGNTPTIVNNLKSAGACKATFFVIGQNMPGNSSSYKSAGFSVQNHTQTHQHMTSWSYQQVYNDMNSCNTAVQNAGFPKPVAIRLPYLESNSTIQQACSALGLQIISPSVDSQDWNGASTQSIISTVSGMSSGQNPLMHENQGNTVPAIATIVSNLKNKGLGFAQY